MNKIERIAEYRLKAITYLKQQALENKQEIQGLLDQSARQKQQLAHYETLHLMKAKTTPAWLAFKFFIKSVLNKNK